MFINAAVSVVGLGLLVAQKGSTHEISSAWGFSILGHSLRREIVKERQRGQVEKVYFSSCLSGKPCLLGLVFMLFGPNAIIRVMDS